MADELSIMVRVKNLVKQGFDSAVSSVNDFRQRLSAGISSAVGSLGGMIAGVAGVAGALGLLKKAFAEAFEQERINAQFAIFFKNTETAKQHVEDLEAIAAKTSFDLPGLASASRSLLGMTDGVLGLKNSMIMVADAATAAGQDVGSVAQAVGMAYNQIKDGEPIGRAALQLQHMGLLSGTAAKRLEDLQKAGADNITVWRAFQTEMEASKGAMDKLSQAGEGLQNQLSKEFSKALEEFGTALSDAGKTGLQGLIDWIHKLREDGTLQQWAETAATMFQAVGKVVGWLVGLIGGVLEKVRLLSSWMGAFAGEMSNIKAEEGGTINPVEYLKRVSRAGLAAGEQVQKQEEDRAKEAAKKEAQRTAPPAALPAKTKEQIDAETAAVEKKMEEARQEQAKEIAKAYEEAKKGLRSVELNAAELGLGAFEFELKEPGSESVTAGKERLKKSVEAYKDKVTNTGEIKAAEAEIKAGKDAIETRGFEEDKARAEKAESFWRSEQDRLQTRRGMSAKQRSTSERELRKKISKDAVTLEELDAMKEREKQGGKLTPAEKAALEGDKAFEAKLQKLKDRSSKYARETRGKFGEMPMTAAEKALLDEAKARDAAAQAKQAAIDAQKNIDARNRQEENAWAAIIRQEGKLDALLQLK